MADLGPLVTGQMSAQDAQPLILDTARDMERFLDAAPEAGDEIISIIERRIGSNRNRDSWGNMESSLVSYAGREITDLLLWTLSFDSLARIEMLDGDEMKRATVLLRRVAGLYGLELMDAFTKWNQRADDWVNISAEMLLSPLNGHYYVNLRIQKVDGQELLLEMPADGFLSLARALNENVRTIGAPEAFSEELRKDYLEGLENTKQFLEEGTNT